MDSQWTTSEVEVTPWCYRGRTALELLHQGNFVARFEKHEHLARAIERYEKAGRVKVKVLVSVEPSGDSWREMYFGGWSRGSWHVKAGTTSDDELRARRREQRAKPSRYSYRCPVRRDTKLFYNELLVGAYAAPSLAMAGAERFEDRGHAWVWMHRPLREAIE